LKEIIRICKPGGFIFFTRVIYVDRRFISTGFDEEVGFTQLQNQLEEEHKWKLIEMSAEELITPLQDPETTYIMWIYQVL